LRYRNRNAKIARMTFPVQHTERIDAQGKIDADDWLIIPPSDLGDRVPVDAALADRMAQLFFGTVSRASSVPLRVNDTAQAVHVLAPMGKTALILADPQRILDAQRAETSWSITGGFLLAHGVNYGGRFYLGAEKQGDGSLKLYSTLRRFPPRLAPYISVPRGIALYKRTQGATIQRIQTRFLQEMAAHLTTAPR